MAKKLEASWMPEWADELPWLQTDTLYNLCEQANGNIFIDVGCFIGGFTKIMAKWAKKRDGKVYSIDLFDNSCEPIACWGVHKEYDVKEIFLRNIRDRGLEKYVEVIKGCSWEVAEKFENESVDFIYIDAEHKYNSCKKDIQNWYPKLKKGGMIAGHDYSHTTYDEKYIHEDGHGDRHHGVIKAVNEAFLNKGLNLNHKHNIWWHKKESE